MAFNTVGIQDNLPVLPVHVLQLIESLTFTGAYSAEDFFREGRTNFGAAAFTSSAHVEMHSLNGADPLVIYSGPFNNTEVFSVDMGGATTATSLTASNATITTLGVANEAVINSSITNATINNATIQTELVTNTIIQNATVNTLQAAAGDIVTLTAGDATIANTTTTDDLVVNTSATIDTATIRNATISTGSVTTLTSTVGTIGTLASTTISTTAITASGTLVNGNAKIVGTETVTGSIIVNRTNNDYTNTDGANSHIQLTNPLSNGQNVISNIINGQLVTKTRADFASGLTNIVYGNGYHAWFVNGDFPTGTMAMFISASGAIGMGTQTMGANKLAVIGGVQATSFTGSFVGPLQGTASYASQALTASYALGGPGGGGGVPGGTNTQIQYNNNGVFDGVPFLRYQSGQLVATGSFSGSLVGTATTASYVALQGLGITVTGTQLTASVRTVNGQFPTNGNVQASLTATRTGTSASLIVSSSGTVTASLADGLVWVVSNDLTASNNGKVFIYASSSVGRWYPISPLDTSQGDARYLMLTPQSALAGDLSLGGNDITNVLSISASSDIEGSTIISNDYFRLFKNGSPAGYYSEISAVNITDLHSNALPDQDGTFAIGIKNSLGTFTADNSGSILVETVPTASRAVSASYALTASYVASVGTPTISTLGDTIYSSNPATTNVAYGVPSYQFRNIFIGSGSGAGTGTSPSNFIADTIAIGTTTASGSTSSPLLIAVGASAAKGANTVGGSIIMGEAAGQGSNNSYTSIMIGGYAGWSANGAFDSILIGNNAGSAYTGGVIKSNNIIIGTNLTLAANRQDSINIGGILFGTGSYRRTSPSDFAPFSGSTANGRIGIRQPNPQYTLDVSGSGNFTSNLTVTGSIIANQRIATLAGTIGGVASQRIYPAYPEIDFSNTANRAAFPHFKESNTGYGVGSGGGYNYYWNDINIGPFNGSNKAGSIKIATDVGATISDSETTTYTLISHGNNTTDFNTNWKNYAGRDHALTVSGSFLARDGVSLGTSLTNQHYISGSVGVVGTMTLNSADVITNQGDTYTSTAAVTKVVSLSAAEYAAITTPDANTLYIVI